MDRSLHVVSGFCLDATIDSWPPQAFPIWQLASLEPAIESVSTHCYISVITQMISYHMFNIVLVRNKLCVLYTQGKAMRQGPTMKVQGLLASV